uniref:Uncharacterized protein n=1 Tax=Moniliophthora roreri TaxID=221103 RepID=A0A0W0FPU3_MONRR
MHTRHRLTIDATLHPTSNQRRSFQKGILARSPLSPNPAPMPSLSVSLTTSPAFIQSSMSLSLNPSTHLKYLTTLNHLHLQLRLITKVNR